MAQNCVQDKILIQEFKTATALKQEIRNRIRERKKMNWQLCSLKAQGGFITVIYQQSRDKPGES